MNKERFFDFIYICLVVFLTCWFFWEVIIKNYVENYVENYIKTNYGYAIMETHETIKTIKENIYNDKNGS